MELKYNILPHGDSGLVIEFDNKGTESGWKQTNDLATYLYRNKIEGILGFIPSYASIFIHIDLNVTDPFLIEDKLHNILSQKHTGTNIEQTGRVFKIPVLYGDKWGEDLGVLSSELNMSEDEIISLHCSKPFKIKLIGAPIGQPMMDGVQFPKPVLKRVDPRQSVPAGSVAVAGNETLIYTKNVPGGWKIIGQTPINLVSRESNPPIQYKPGDYIKFFPIKENELDIYQNLSTSDLMESARVVEKCSL